MPETKPGDDQPEEGSEIPVQGEEQETEEGSDEPTDESIARDEEAQEKADAIPPHAREGLDPTAFSDDSEDDEEEEAK
jgi:hypothetical protein